MAVGGFAGRRAVPRLARRLFRRIFGDRGYISGELAEDLLVSRRVRLIT